MFRIIDIILDYKMIIKLFLEIGVGIVENGSY